MTTPPTPHPTADTSSPPPEAVRVSWRGRVHRPRRNRDPYRRRRHLLYPPPPTDQATPSSRRPSRGRSPRAERRAARARLRRVRREWRLSPRRGDGTGRAVLPIRVPAHRATTRNLQGLYPFVVDASLGSAGAYIGRQAGSDASFVHDPWQRYHAGVVTNPNMLLAGVIGRGKSALAKTLALRLTAFGVRVYVPGDPKGEWATIAHALGCAPILLGRGLPARINPLDPGHRPPGLTDPDWACEVRARRLGLLAALAETTLERRLTPVERSALVLALDQLTTPGAPAPAVRGCRCCPTSWTG